MFKVDRVDIFFKYLIQGKEYPRIFKWIVGEDLIWIGSKKGSKN